MRGARIPLALALPLAVCIGAASCNSESLFPPLGGEPSPTPSGSPTPTPDPRPASVQAAGSAIDELTITWETGPFDSYVAYVGTDAGLAGISWRTASATAHPVSTPPLVVPASGGKPTYVRVVAVIGGNETDGPGTLELEPVGSGWNGLAMSTDGSATWTRTGVEQGEEFGTAIAGLGGSTGDDAYEEFAIGSPKSTSSQGMVRVFFGSAAGPQPTPVEILGVTGQSEMGRSLAGGYVNADAYADLIAGAPGYDDTDPAGPGAALVFLGDPVDGIDTTASAVGEGTVTNEFTGHSVAAIGDVDNDSRTEVAAGAPNRTNTLLRQGGWRAWRTGSQTVIETTPFAESQGPQAEMQYGHAVSGGDFDGDGRADLLVSAPYWDEGAAMNAGTVHLLRGVSTPALVFAASVEATAFIGFGLAVAGVGDVDGDQREDFVVGAPIFGPNTRGTAFLYRGQSTIPYHSVSDWAPIGEENWRLGEVITGADFNGDGFSDVALGAHFADGGLGRVQVYLGGPGGLQDDPSFVLHGVEDLDLFGEALGHADVNGDGSADLLVGAPSSSTLSGKAWLFYGPPRKGPVVDAGIGRTVGVDEDVTLIGADVKAAGMDARLRCTVDWGDGSALVSISPCTNAALEAASHAYASPGVFAVRVTATSLGYGVTGQSLFDVTVEE